MGIGKEYSCDLVFIPKCSSNDAFPAAVLGFESGDGHSFNVVGFSDYYNHIFLRYEVIPTDLSSVWYYFSSPLARIFFTDFKQLFFDYF